MIEVWLYRISCLSLSVIGLLASVTAQNRCYAQLTEDLRLYGYFQVLGRYGNIDANPKTSIEETTSFSVQQFNLFLNKQIDSNFNAFVDLELTNSFSSLDGWGGLKIEEAWLRYKNDRRLRIKVGLLIPTFNNLNEIKNRTPILPYIQRPMAYETALKGLVNIDEYVPQQAYVEVYGSVPINDWAKFDYATYVGNQNGFITSEASGAEVSGRDTTVAKLIGSRIGIRWKTAKVGVSGTFDMSNQDVLRFSNFAFQGIGAVDRFRIGLDLSKTLNSYFFESELIRVFYRPSTQQKQFLAASSDANLFLGSEIDKLFVYGLVGKHVYDRFFVYAMYSYISDETLRILRDGVGQISVGGGIRPNSAITFKVQYINTRTYADSFLFVKMNEVLIGFSVFL